jgi:hypothetical protein
VTTSAALFNQGASLANREPLNASGEFFRRAQAITDRRFGTYTHTVDGSAAELPLQSPRICEPAQFCAAWGRSTEQMAKDEEPLRFRVNDVWYEVVDSDWLRNIEAGALEAGNNGLLSAIRKETDHSGAKPQEHFEQATELQRLVDAMQQWIDDERQKGRPEDELQRLTVRDFFAHLRSRRAASRRPKRPDGE